jgi:hypothetical protein
MYSRHSSATTPEWFSRRNSALRQADLKELYWSWEQPSKPTEKTTFGLLSDVKHPCTQSGYQAAPHDIDGQVNMSRWGIYHPPSYQELSRTVNLPPLHITHKRG